MSRRLHGRLYLPVALTTPTLRRSDDETAARRSSRAGLPSRAFLSFALAAASLLAPTSSHAALGDCSQPSSSGANPTPTDCLTILRKAVNLPVVGCEPECICAPGGSLPVSPTDALVCLRKAVGQMQELSCPCGPTTTTSSSTTSTSVSTTTSTSITLPSIESAALAEPAICAFDPDPPGLDW